MMIRLRELTGLIIDGNQLIEINLEEDNRTVFLGPLKDAPSTYDEAKVNHIFPTVHYDTYLGIQLVLGSTIGGINDEV